VKLGGEREIAESDDAQTRGHGYRPCVRLYHHAEREQVRAAEHAIDIRMLAQQLRQRVTALLQIRRRAHPMHRRHRRGSTRTYCIGEGLRPPPRAHVVGTDDGRMAVAALDDVARHRRTGLLVRKTDQHVDRIGREVPRLDDRYARSDQALPRVPRVHHAGDDDAIGPPADDRIEQRVFARIVIAALPQIGRAHV
jgi:hypothetical protein